MTAIDALQVLSQALRLETEGMAFYMQAATETLDPKGKELFKSLADDERKHKDMIIRQLHALEGGGDYVLLPNMNVAPIDLAKPLFPPSKEDVVQRTGEYPTEQDALFLAMENEIKSYDLYRAEAQKTTGAAQQMYQWLASAEMTHFNLLMSNWEALNANGTWV